MRMTVNINDINNFNVKVVGGPYLGNGRGSSTKWDFLCPYCNNTFKAPTTNFKNSKSCYSCRGKALRKSSELITWKNHYGMVKGRKNAKEKGFDLTLEQFIELSQKDCFYCKSKPTATKGHRQWSTVIYTNGLDRINPNMGYLYYNIVACCKYCNIAKLDRTQEEFYSWVLSLAKQIKKIM